MVSLSRVLSVAVSLTPSLRCCRPHGVSSPRFHPPTRPFPTERLPRAGSPPFHRYYERATTSDSPLLPLHSSLRVRFSGRPSQFAHAGGTVTAPVPGILVSRYALLPARFPGRLPDLPSSHETLAPVPILSRPTHTYALLSDPGRASAPHPGGAPVPSLCVQRSRTSAMRQFRGSITRLGARCLRFMPPLRYDDARLACGW